ncbi:MAG: hypothetical protein ABWY16_08000 [Pedobacter sp.]|uniref:hypothetical protein n=1 Tax=Pedobacter sp. TaxID=1411316 RepID=UPI00339A8A4F
MQYIYEDQYKGKARKLLIFPPNEGQDYRVFCQGSFLGSIRPVTGGDEAVIWKTEYNILKPIAGKIGEFIATSQSACTPERYDNA